MKKTIIALSVVAVAAPALPTQAALVGYYEFEAANPLADSSGMGNNLTLVGGAADPTHVGGGGYAGSGAYDYNGANRVIAPIDINPGAMPSMTMGAWVRTDALPVGAGTPQLHKVMGHDNGAWDRVLGLDTRTAAAGGGQAQHALRYTAFTGTNNHGPIQSTLAPGSTADWTFLAVVYDQPSNTATIFIDLDATTSEPLFSASRPTAMGPGAGSLSIGSIRPDLPNEGWDGAIDQAFIFDTALTGAELTAFRDAGRVPEPSAILLSLFAGAGLLLRRRRR